MRRLFALATVLAAAGLGTMAGCGGDERVSREEFRDRLESISQEGGERWERLARRAERLQPGQALPTGVEQALLELNEFQRRTADELAGLEPPEGTEAEVEKLIKALRMRTRAFEQAVDAGRFTERQFVRITRAGELIDDAVDQLREEGYLPETDDHAGE